VSRCSLSLRIQGEEKGQRGQISKYVNCGTLQHCMVIKRERETEVMERLITPLGLKPKTKRCSLSGRFRWQRMGADVRSGLRRGFYKGRKRKIPLKRGGKKKGWKWGGGQQGGEGRKRKTSGKRLSLLGGGTNRSIILRTGVRSRTFEEGG